METMEDLRILAAEFSAHVACCPRCAEGVRSECKTETDALRAFCQIGCDCLDRIGRAGARAGITMQSLRIGNTLN